MKFNKPTGRIIAQSAGAKNTPTASLQTLLTSVLDMTVNILMVKFE